MKTSENNLKLGAAKIENASVPGKPFQSKFEAHVSTIQAMRRQRKTWQEIADHLTEAGCPTSKGNLFNFFKRWKRRPYAFGAEPVAPPPVESSPVNILFAPL